MPAKSISPPLPSSGPSADSPRPVGGGGGTHGAGGPPPAPRPRNDTQNNDVDIAFFFAEVSFATIGVNLMSEK